MILSPKLFGCYTVYFSLSTIFIFYHYTQSNQYLSGLVLSCRCWSVYHRNEFMNVVDKHFQEFEVGISQKHGDKGKLDKIKN